MPFHAGALWSWWGRSPPRATSSPPPRPCALPCSKLATASTFGYRLLTSFVGPGRSPRALPGMPYAASSCNRLKPLLDLHTHPDALLQKVSQQKQLARQRRQRRRDGAWGGPHAGADSDDDSGDEGDDQSQADSLDAHGSMSAVGGEEPLATDADAAGHSLSGHTLLPLVSSRPPCHARQAALVLCSRLQLV